MTRRAARINQDEISRLIKGVQTTGLSIAKIVFDGEAITVIIGDPLAKEASSQPADKSEVKLLRKPVL